MQTISFDIRIESAGEAYTLSAAAPATIGDLPAQPFRPPFDLATLPRQRGEIGRWIAQARLSRLSEPEELRAAHEFGRALFGSLFSGEVLAGFRASRRRLVPGECLCIRLRMTPELASLPWELLFDPTESQFLALAPDLTLVRYPALMVPATPLAIQGPLQVVVVLASPQTGGYPPIRVDREQHIIEAALKPLRERGQITLDVISGVGTLDQLRERLRRPVHALHILSHGNLDTDRGEGVLIFSDALGDPEPINAELLRHYLQRQQGHTRLVLLNACLGALPAGADYFSSVGAALIRSGVPAVIAMQFEIPEQTAAELARVFYAELAAGVPVDRALTEARLHLYGRYRSQLDWAVPVLFMRTDEPTLFDAVQASVPPQPAEELVASASIPSARGSKGRSWAVYIWVALAVILVAASGAIYRTLIPGQATPTVPTSAAGSSAPISDATTEPTRTAAPATPPALASVTAASPQPTPAPTIATTPQPSGKPLPQCEFDTTSANSIRAMAFSHDNKLLAVAGEDHFIYIRGADTCEEIASFRAHDNTVTSVAWSPNDKRLVSGSDDRTVRIWDVSSLSQTVDPMLIVTYDQTQRGHTDSVLAVAWAPDGNRLASIGFDGKVIVWKVEESHLKEGQILWQQDVHDKGFGAAWQPTPGTLLAISRLNEVRVFDPGNNTELTPTPDATTWGEIKDLAWSPNSQCLAVTGEDGSVYAWPIAHPEDVQQLKGHSRGVTSVTWSHDGRFLASTAAFGPALIWDVAAGTRLAIEFAADSGGDWPQAVEWSPAGNLLAIAYVRQVRIYDATQFVPISSTPVATSGASMSCQ